MPCLWHQQPYLESCKTFVCMVLSPHRLNAVVVLLDRGIYVRFYIFDSVCVGSLLVSHTDNASDGSIRPLIPVSQACVLTHHHCHHPTVQTRRTQFSRRPTVRGRFSRRLRAAAGLASVRPRMSYLSTYACACFEYHQLADYSCRHHLE